jgi:hypothetical protein
MIEALSDGTLVPKQRCFASAHATSEGGGWECQTTASGSCGATAWMRSHADLQFLPRTRWVVERTFAWLSQVRSQRARTTSGCPRWPKP